MFLNIKLKVSVGRVYRNTGVTAFCSKPIVTICWFIWAGNLVGSRIKYERSYWTYVCRAFWVRFPELGRPTANVDGAVKRQPRLKRSWRKFCLLPHCPCGSHWECTSPTVATAVTPPSLASEPRVFSFHPGLKTEALQKSHRPSTPDWDCWELQG